MNSVPHVHTHIIPRHFKDLPHEDQIYTMLESTDGDLGKNYLEAQHPNMVNSASDGTSIKVGVTQERPKFPTVMPDEARVPRTEEVMEKEANWLAGFMKEHDANL
jgi:bis(5'-adenosyl)-triphosphatase